MAIRNLSSLTVFDLDGWNKYHFIGNWITYIGKCSDFSLSICFNLKKKKKKHKIMKNFNFYILFFIFILNRALSAMHLVFVNEIKWYIFFYLWNWTSSWGHRAPRTGPFFGGHRAPKKHIFSMQIVFFTFYRKSLETNCVWDLMTHIFCL